MPKRLNVDQEINLMLMRLRRFRDQSERLFDELENQLLAMVPDKKKNQYPRNVKNLKKRVKAW
jgi:hypothetical protein